MAMAGKNTNNGGIKQYAKGNKEKPNVDFYFARYREFSILFGGLKVTYVYSAVSKAIPRIQKRT